MKNSSDFCIVGGGVTGLVSALVLERYFPTKKINLIYSPKHKEIGVGESTNEVYIQFLYTVQIDPGEFYRYCDAVPKYAVKQKDWVRDGTDWYHFLSQSNNIIAEDPALSPLWPLPDQTHYWSKRVLFNIDPEIETNTFNKKHLVLGELIRQEDVAFDCLPASANFDNFKAIDFLRKVCEERGINMIADTIKGSQLNNNTGYIEELIGEKISYTSSFYFDATGFSSLLLGGSLGVKNISFEKDFLVNRYTAFPTPLSHPPDPAVYVETIGKDDCWIWKIETAGRGGNGVLYSSDFMTDENLERHVKNEGGDMNNLLAYAAKFQPCYRKEILHKNVLGLGLCAAFFEPLQATTFGFVLKQLLYFVHVYNAWKHEPIAVENMYNDTQLNNIKNIYYWIKTQYITKKNNPFWRAQREDTRYSFGLSEKLKIWKYRPPYYNHDIGNISVDMKRSTGAMSFFNTGHFYQLLCGMEMVDHNAILKYNDELLPHQNNLSKEELEKVSDPRSNNSVYVPSGILINAIVDITTNRERYDKYYKITLSHDEYYVYTVNKISYLIPKHIVFLPFDIKERQLIKRSSLAYE